MASSLASQSLYITTSRRPRSLAESRLILTALQRFGEVVTFRSLKFDTTNTLHTAPRSQRSILAIFDSPASASNALAASPLHIPLPIPPSPAEENKYQNQRQQQQQQRGQENAEAEAEAELEAEAEEEEEAESFHTHLFCTLQPSHHNHVSALKRNPFHARFRVDKTSDVYRALVAEGIPLRQLADVPMARKGFGSLKVKTKVSGEVERAGGRSLMGFLYREGVSREKID